MRRGQNPHRVESLLRVAGASASGQALVLSAPLPEFNYMSPTLQQIQASFAVGRR